MLENDDDQFNNEINLNKLYYRFVENSHFCSKCIQKLKDIEWGNYYEIHNYSQTALNHKQQTINEFLQKVQPSSVWDLGANTGMFSRQASETGINTVAFDLDPKAVELNYLECKSKSENNLYPLLLDFTNPSSAFLM